MSLAFITSLRCINVFHWRSFKAASDWPCSFLYPNITLAALLGYFNSRRREVIYSILLLFMNSFGGLRTPTFCNPWFDIDGAHFSFDVLSENIRVWPFYRAYFSLPLFTGRISVSPFYRQHLILTFLLNTFQFDLFTGHISVWPFSSAYFSLTFLPGTFQFETLFISFFPTNFELLTTFAKVGCHTATFPPPPTPLGIPMISRDGYVRVLEINLLLFG